MNTKDFKFEVKGVQEDGTFEGYLSVFNVVDLGGDLVLPGAFKKTIEEQKGIVPLLWQHDSKQPIGTLSIEEDEYGLKVSGNLLLELKQANEAYVLLKAGVLRGLSIGYETIKKSMVEGVRHLKELRLFEGSVVTFPMLPIAQVSSVKAQEEIAEEFAEIYMELKVGRALSAERALRLRTIMNEIQSLLEGAEPVATVTEITPLEEPTSKSAEPDFHSLLSAFDRKISLK